MNGTERGLDPSIGVGWPGALTLLAQAAASSSPRHRATSCTLGSSRPSGGALPSAPKSYKESRGGLVRGQGQPRLSHCALRESPQVTLLPLEVSAQSRGRAVVAGG